MIMVEDVIKAKLQTLPELPGIYQFFDNKGQIIYVGKAKNLKRRVSSYFNKEQESGKTRILVRKIADIQHLVVDTEEDALLLENNLIKKYLPRYNILLKDDKTYPWIVVKNEPFPRVSQTRTVVKDGSSYFGPYTSGLVVKNLLELFRQLYPLRNCSLLLTSANIESGKYKVCLEYHLKNCLGPCIGEYDEISYLNHIEEIKSILKGNIGDVSKCVRELMFTYAENFQFEKAEGLKQKLLLLDSFQKKSLVVNASINNVDVFSIIDDDDSVYVNYLRITNGAIIQTHTLEYKKRLDETLEEVFPLAIIELRDRFNSVSSEILVPFLPDIKLKGVDIVVPKIGDKKKLLELSERNVSFYRLDKLKQQSIMKREPHEVRIMNTLMKDLRMKELPTHIECFDNSNIQGTNPVAACVVFKNAKASKKDYRHFNVKTVEGPDDFASMREIIYRRYRRLLDEKSPLPQLIIIDGGKGQLGAAVESLNELKIFDVAIIGIAKRLEEIYFPGDPYPLYLDKNSESLKLIQQMRNEAHRFGITFHRKKRSDEFIHSELNDIKGIGEATIKILFQKFKSVEKIKNAGREDIVTVIGDAKTKLLLNYLKSKDKSAD
jgi:excinuclease ABC subunit C